ncbi:MAG TPA: sigma-70 family RNA polymerase sigma factor [Thermoleophilaceae bacterium]
MTPRALLAPARLAGQSVLRTQTDERLVDLAAAGSEPAFEAIVARYRRPLMAYLRGILAEERADDALQQTFVRAHAAILREDRVRCLRAWLYRIAHNSAANLIRDTHRPDEPLPEHVPGAELPDDVAYRRQTFSEVLSAVQSLPLRQRDAIVLRELEGRSYEEIAGELGVTDGAVRALLNRARTTIRQSVTALTPVDLLVRMLLPVADSPVPALSKMCAAMMVTGAAAGGIQPAPPAHHERAARSGPAPAVTAPARPRGLATRPAPAPRRAVSAPRRFQAASTAAARRRIARPQRETSRPEPADRPERQEPESRPEPAPDRHTQPQQPHARSWDQPREASGPAGVESMHTDEPGPRPDGR